METPYVKQLLKERFVDGQELGEFEKQFVSNPDLLPNLFRGEVAFAASRATSQYLICAEVNLAGANPGNWSATIAASLGHDPKKGTKLRTEKVLDTTCQIITIPLDENRPAAKGAWEAWLRSKELPQQIGFLVRDSRVVISFGEDPKQIIQDLSMVLTRWNGRHHDTFAKTEIYQAIRQHATNGAESSTSPPAALRWYLGITRLEHDLMKEGERPFTKEDLEKADFHGPLWNLWCELGMTDLPRLTPTYGRRRGIMDDVPFQHEESAAGGELRFNHGEHDLLIRTVVVPPVYHLDEFESAVAGNLRPLPDAPPPKWIPSDVSQYWEWCWRESVLNAPKSHISSVSEDEEQLVAALDVFVQHKLVNKERKFSQLATGIVRLIADVEIDEDPSAGGMVLALALRDQASQQAVLEALKKLTPEDGALASQKVWQIIVPAKPEKKDGKKSESAKEDVPAEEAKANRSEKDKSPAEPKIAYAALFEQHLLIASNTERLRRIIQPKIRIPPLSELARYRADSRQYPHNSLFRSFRQYSDAELASLAKPESSKKSENAHPLGAKKFPLTRQLPVLGSFESLPDGCYRATLVRSRDKK